MMMKMKALQLLSKNIMCQKLKQKTLMCQLDEKPSFEIPVKNKEEAYEAFIEMSKNNDYTTGNL